MSKANAGARRSGRRPALNIDTSDYVRTHGRAPRGRGGWAFCPRSKYNLNNYLDHVLWAPSSTYADAKKWLRAQGATGDWVACT